MDTRNRDARPTPQVHVLQHHDAAKAVVGTFPSSGRVAAELSRSSCRAPTIDAFSQPPTRRHLDAECWRAGFSPTKKRASLYFATVAPVDVPSELNRSLASPASTLLRGTLARQRSAHVGERDLIAAVRERPHPVAGNVDQDPRVMSASPVRRRRLEPAGRRGCAP